MKNKTKISITPEMRRWNEAVERADCVLNAHYEPGRDRDPEALFTALCSASLYQTAEELLHAGRAVGYFPESAPRP